MINTGPVPAQRFNEDADGPWSEQIVVQVTLRNVQEEPKV